MADKLTSISPFLNPSKILHDVLTQVPPPLTHQILKKYHLWRAPPPMFSIPMGNSTSAMIKDAYPGVKNNGININHISARLLHINPGFYTKYFDSVGYQFKFEMGAMKSGFILSPRSHLQTLI